MDGNGTIKIDKGISMPWARTGCIPKYPFREMAVGDSFLFPKGYAISHYYGMAREFTSQTAATGERRVFKARKTDEGYRCWRVE